MKLLERARAALAMMVAPESMAGQMLVNISNPQGHPPKLDTRALEQSYSRIPWMQISGRIANTCAEPRWFIAWPQGSRSRAKGLVREIESYNFQERSRVVQGMVEEGEVRKIIRHPLLNLIQNGNPLLPGFDQKRLLFIHVDLVGEAYLLLDHNAYGVPHQAFIVPPSWVKETPTPQKPEYFFQHDSWRLHWPEDRVLLIKDPDPAHPYARGAGLGRSLADEVMQVEYVSKFLSTFFFREARPPVLIAGAGVEPNHTKALEETWVQKALRRLPMFLRGEVKLWQLGHSLEQMQMSALQKNSRDTMMASFGYPPEKMGVLSRPGGSSPPMGRVARKAPEVSGETPSDGWPPRSPTREPPASVSKSSARAPPDTCGRILSARHRTSIAHTG